jgi:multiple antibiotic resistance protein
MDPFASIPPFLEMTKGRKESECASVARNAVLIAGVIAVIFILVGTPLLDALLITLADFKVAGGIVLIILGLENILGFANRSKADMKEGLDQIAVLIATPLLTGPGLMTSAVLLTEENGLAVVLPALLVTLILSWIVLHFADSARNVIGVKVIRVFSKVMMLFLIAMGVAFIRSGMGI